jgi:hypothetical protein
VLSAEEATCCQVSVASPQPNLTVLIQHLVLGKSTSNATKRRMTDGHRHYSRPTSALRQARYTPNPKLEKIAEVLPKKVDGPQL